MMGTHRLARVARSTVEYVLAHTRFRSAHVLFIKPMHLEWGVPFLDLVSSFFTP